MEISGTVLRSVTYVSGSGAQSKYGGAVDGAWGRSRVRMGSGSGFCDEGHVQYYQDRKKETPVLTSKKKLKLLKSLSKLGFSLDPQQRALFSDLQTNLTSDAGEELLMRELEQMRAKEKEMKKKRKQEKKAKLKASKMNCESSSSSSSESSDCDCDEVVNMNSLRSGVVVPAPVDELKLQPPARLSLPQTTVVEDAIAANRHAMELLSNNDTSVGCTSVCFKKESAVVAAAPQKRIEVCMGNKCKRSGAAALLQEFEKVVGVEGGAVVACKCMGKCKTAPNVRVQNSVDHSLAEGLNDSVKIPANPLCIGVGLEDVDAIVARFLGENQRDMSVAGAAT